MNFTNMKVGTRLGIGFGSLLVLLALMLSTGIWCLQMAGSATNYMVNEALVKERLVKEWHSATHVNGARANGLAESANMAGQKRVEDQIKATTQHISEIQKKLDAMPKNAEEVALFSVIAEKRNAYRTARDAVFNEKKAGREDMARKLIDEKLEPALNTYLVSINQLNAYQARTIATLSSDVKDQYRTGMLLLTVLGGGALLVGIAAAVGITRSLLKQLGGEPGYATAVAGKIAAGDLSVNIDIRHDDQSSLMFALKTMRDSLASIVTGVRLCTDTLAAATDQLAHGNLDLSTRTEQQASSLEETASSMEQLTSVVKQNTDNAHQAKGLATTASDVAIKGGSVVSHVVDTMGSINESSKKIVDIISVIDGIAFQTNILALNAAVEAARAGEQGRGFAVVASEVRNLAQRSAAAAKEIKILINDSVEKVHTGSELVNRAGATMSEIVNSVQRVTDIINEIAFASREQSNGIEQINQAILQMDQVTQQNAALVEEAAAAADSMKEQMRSLVQAVSVFSLGNINALTMSSPMRPALAHGQIK